MPSISIACPYCNNVFSILHNREETYCPNCGALVRHKTARQERLVIYNPKSKTRFGKAMKYSYGGSRHDTDPE